MGQLSLEQRAELFLKPNEQEIVYAIWDVISELGAEELLTPELLSSFAAQLGYFLDEKFGYIKDPYEPALPKKERKRSKSLALRTFLDKVQSRRNKGLRIPPFSDQEIFYLSWWWSTVFKASTNVAITDYLDCYAKIKGLYWDESKRKYLEKESISDATI